MTWEYRVLKSSWPDRDEVRFAVHEVYYEDGETEPSSCTRTPVEAEGETVEELRTDLKRQLAALDKPVLDHALFKT